MPPRKLVRRQAKERFCGAWAEHGTNGAERPGHVPYVERCARSADDHRADHMSLAVVLIAEQTQWIVRQAEDEVHRARRQHVLASSLGGMCTGLVHGPDSLYERTQLRSRETLHTNIITRRTAGRAVHTHRPSVILTVSLRRQLSVTLPHRHVGVTCLH